MFLVLIEFNVECERFEKWMSAALFVDSPEEIKLNDTIWHEWRKNRETAMQCNGVGLHSEVNLLLPSTSVRSQENSKETNGPLIILESIPLPCPGRGKANEVIPWMKFGIECPFLLGLNQNLGHLKNETNLTRDIITNEHFRNSLGNS